MNGVYDYYLKRNSAFYAQHFAASLSEFNRMIGAPEKTNYWLRKGLYDFDIKGCSSAELLCQLGGGFTVSGLLDSADYYLNLSLSLCSPEADNSNKMIYRRIGSIGKSQRQLSKSN